MPVRLYLQTVPNGSVLEARQVFTPTQPAVVNVVPRNRVNNRLVDAIRTPGKQLIVYGETGSGKSTILRQKLHELYESHITSRCTSETTFDQLVLDAFDQLGAFFASETSHSSETDLHAGVSYAALSATVGRMSTDATTSSRIVPPQLTPQRLGALLGAQHLCWVIEDFHKPAPEEKRKLAQVLKVFSDLSTEYSAVKIIAVGATETARQIVEYEPEMANRVAEILIPLMDADEIKQIITQGQVMLNLDLDALSPAFVQYSLGVPSVCHQLCLNACQMRNVSVTCASTESFTEEDLAEVLRQYIEESSDTLKAAFDRALQRHRSRSYDNPRLILRAIAAGPLTGSSHGELLSRIRQEAPSYPSGNLTQYLKELTSPKRGEIIRHTPAHTYRFSDPLHHSFAQAFLLQAPATQSVWNWSYYERQQVQNTVWSALLSWPTSDALLTYRFDALEEPFRVDPSIFYLQVPGNEAGTERGADQDEEVPGSGATPSTPPDDASDDHGTDEER